MRALLAMLLTAFASSASPQVLPIFDAHLHYSHDAWETVPVEQAIDIMFGADADLPVPRRMVELARRHRLFLHAHSDADAIERLFKQWPQARILWAHAGFERPERVAEMLRKYRNLWCDLAFRTDHASGGKVDAAWRTVFLEFPERFMVGTDSYTPERWHYIPAHAEWSRQWLAGLPRDVAERIAWKNGETVFGSLLQSH